MSAAEPIDAGAEPVGQQSRASAWGEKNYIRNVKPIETVRPADYSPQQYPV